MHDFPEIYLMLMSMPHPNADDGASISQMMPSLSLFRPPLPPSHSQINLQLFQLHRALLDRVACPEHLRIIVQLQLIPNSPFHAQLHMPLLLGLGPDVRLHLGLDEAILPLEPNVKRLLELGNQLRPTSGHSSVKWRPRITVLPVRVSINI
jgi:hypothetical protein